MKVFRWGNIYCKNGYKISEGNHNLLVDHINCETCDFGRDCYTVERILSSDGRFEEIEISVQPLLPEETESKETKNAVSFVSDRVLEQLNLYDEMLHNVRLGREALGMGHNKLRQSKNAKLKNSSTGGY